MKSRNIERIIHADSFKMGNMVVKQPLPADRFNKVGPFILLHHAGPQVIKAGSKKFRIDPHPHRGFEPVTFIFQGEVEHLDSKGNHGLLKADEVQWMTAGSGIIHSEGPPESFFERGGTMEIIQLWINLPKSHKMLEPTYQDIKREMIPLIKEENGDLKINLIAGEYEGLKGPAITATPMTVLTIYAEEGVEKEFLFPSEFAVALYLLEGELLINGERILVKENMVVFDQAGESLNFKVTSKSKMLLLAGEPINEPMVSHGPFVMNTVEEINQAMEDYYDGKMGTLTK